MWAINFDDVKALKMLIRRIVKIPSKTDKDFYGARGAASDPAIITLMVMVVLMVILIMMMV